MKFLLVGFDDLRPNLLRFAQRGVSFENHRYCFPSSIYVNLPSLVTGTTPAQHGIEGKEFPVPYRLDLGREMIDSTNQ